MYRRSVNFRRQSILVDDPFRRKLNTRNILHNEYIFITRKLLTKTCDIITINAQTIPVTTHVIYMLYSWHFLTSTNILYLLSLSLSQDHRTCPICRVEVTS